MQTMNKLLFTIYVIIFIPLIIFTVFPNELKTLDRTIEFQSTVPVNKIQIFNLMSEIEKYPLIFPDTFVAVEILNQTNHSIKTLETAKEMGIEKTFQIQHDLIPFESHEITILDGDAKGTKIVVWFNKIDENSTELSVKINLHVKGILVPFGILPESNFEHAFNTILKGFVEYTN
jgi:coenzyme Q-binding protein COQ10